VVLETTTKKIKGIVVIKTGTKNNILPKSRVLRLIKMNS